MLNSKSLKFTLKVAIMRPTKSLKFTLNVVINIGLNVQSQKKNYPVKKKLPPRKTPGKNKILVMPVVSILFQIPAQRLTKK
jgi:hypothetical protein